MPLYKHANNLRNALLNLNDAVKDPNKGYPFAYGAAEMIARQAIDEFESTLKQRDARPNEYECPCCGADGESWRGEDYDGDWWSCVQCDANWSQAKRKAARKVAA